MGFLEGPFHLLMGITGNTMSLVLFLEPAHYFYVAWKNGTIQDVIVNSTSAPYHFHLVKCMLWFLYGIALVRRNSSLLLPVYSVGCFIQLGYLLLWVIYLDFWFNKLKVITITMMEILIFVRLIVSSIVNLDDDPKHAYQALGAAAASFHLVMYLYLALQRKLVMTGASVEQVNELVVCARAVDSLVWILYALWPLDQYLTVAYSVGLLLWIVEMACIRYYIRFVGNPRVVPRHVGIELVQQ